MARKAGTRHLAAATTATTPLADPVVGIDISARWFDVARGGDLRRFANTDEGIAACVQWLGRTGRHARVGLEATGTYSLPLATALHAVGHTVFVCNPLSLARYRQATLARTKTDKLDAQCIARFCAAHALHPWRPVSEDHQRLHVLVATRKTLLEQVQQLRNRQHAASYTPCAELVRTLQAPVLAAITAQLARLERELAALADSDTPIGAQLRLLMSIPGLGRTTAATLVASLPVDRLTTSRQVAAYVGLCPREKASGTSVRR
jgi:transposase